MGILWLSGCAAAPAEPAARAALVGSFSVDELFAAGGGGCGMTLWEKGASPRQDGFVFFHGLGDGDAFMVLDGGMRRLRRVEASGQEFWGQRTVQTFATEDGAITIRVDATPGDPGEIESVGIADATITVRADELSEKLSVEGDAGC